MFSIAEKQYLAKVVEDAILGLKHPEMSKERPSFVLSINGKESWSYAIIEPNWTFEENTPDINPWNEITRNILPSSDV